MSRPTSRVVATTAVAAGSAAAAACLIDAVAGPGQVSRMLPWILGRGLGIAAYLTLVALTAVGLWLRHPWRARWPHPSPGLQLQVHAALAGLALMLIVGHVTALVLDPYAGVGARGVVVPGAGSYRPLAVGLGTLSTYAAVIVGGSAALAGRIGRIWRPVHALAAVAFALVFAHGILAGSDTPRLRLMYVGTGVFIAVLTISRRFARPLPGTSPAAPGAAQPVMARAR